MKFLNPQVDLTPSDALFKKYALWRLNTAKKRGKHCAASTINVEISAINSQLHDRGQGITRFTDAIGTKRLIRGIGRYQTEVEGFLPSQTRAMTDVMLDQIVVMIPRIMDRAILLTIKHACLRSDNAVFNDNWHHVKVGDCWFNPSVFNPTSITLALPGSKTNQKRYYEPRNLHCRCNIKGKSAIVCPVHTLQAICKNRIFDIDEPLFILPDGQPYSKQDLAELLEKVALDNGLNPRFYTSKCLRIGQATDMLLQGKSEAWVMAEYNWKSRNTLQKYLRFKNPDMAMFQPVPKGKTVRFYEFYDGT